MQKFLKEYMPYVVIFILVMLVRTFIITPVKVNGTSMDDTLASGDIMLLYKLASIEREDIVVLGPEVQGSNIIKRVIALPGERVKCENGVIYINSKKYDDQYASNITSDFEEIKLAKDEYFVLGDNRLISEDSRYFGPVSKEAIKGEASIVIYPIKKLGKVS
ncbi:MAG: signal peptidase I [Firmicutes bacterium]|nr:signal peptidase I [Bacillota bacterium]